MGCSKNDTDLNIRIPVVMIQRSGGDILNKSMGDGKTGKLLTLRIFLMRQQDKNRESHKFLGETISPQNYDKTDPFRSFGMTDI